MLFRQDRTTLKYIAIFGILASFFLMSVFFLSCDRIQQVVAPHEAATPDDAVTVKIGFIYSPSDPGTTRNGAELAVALANEADGVNGLPIELLVRDDKRDPVLSAQHAEELIDAGVLAIVGPDYDEEAVEVGAVAQQHRIPMLTTYPTNPKVSRNGNFSFMGAYTDPYQASVMVDFAMQELSAMTAAVLTETADTYSEGLSNAFIEGFAAQGGTIAVHRFYETGTTDFTE